jgi:hypothetical protein
LLTLDELLDELENEDEESDSDGLEDETEEMILLAGDDCFLILFLADFSLFVSTSDMLMTELLTETASV